MMAANKEDEKKNMSSYLQAKQNARSEENKTRRLM